MSIKSDGELIIKNATIVNESGRGIQTTGVLTLENVTMNCKNRCLDLRGAGKAEIGEGCTLVSDGGDTTVFVYDEDGNVPELVVKGKVSNPFKAADEKSGGFAISSNGGVKTAGSKIYIEDGAEVSSDYDVAIYMPNVDNVVVNGGKVEGKTGIYQKCGVLTVNGGEVVGNGDNPYTYSSGGCWPTGNAVVVEFTNYPAGLPDAAINGGTLTAADKEGVIGYVKSPKCTEEATAEELAAAHIKAENYSIQAL